MLTAEQKEARMAGIGGSDVAVIMGLSPWKTSYQLFLEKTGQVAEEELDSQVIHFGNVLEDVVATEYMRLHDVKVERRNKMLVHPEHDFMLANIDRKIVGRPAVLECKTADKFTRGGWGEDGSDEIPDQYRLQLEHYMTVGGFSEGVLAVLIGGNEFRSYPIQRDMELSEMLLDGCKVFWDQVQSGNPPELDYSHRTAGDLVKKMHPGTDGTTITLDPLLEHWHMVKQEADEIAKKYTAVSDGIKARINHAIGNAAVGVIPGCHFQYKRSLTKRKESVTKACEFMVTRGSKWSPPKT